MPGLGAWSSCYARACCKRIVSSQGRDLGRYWPVGQVFWSPLEDVEVARGDAFRVLGQWVRLFDQCRRVSARIGQYHRGVQQLLRARDYGPVLFRLWAAAPVGGHVQAEWAGFANMQTMLQRQAGIGCSCIQEPGCQGCPDHDAEPGPRTMESQGQIMPHRLG